MLDGKRESCEEIEQEMDYQKTDNTTTNEQIIKWSEDGIAAK